MSDGDNTKSKPTKGGNAWTEHEFLVYLMSVLEYDNTKLDFANAPAPAGRNSNGCSQKMFKMKQALRAEIDAIKNGESVVASTENTPKKAAGRKRKVATDEDGEPILKKRGRAKKKAVVEPEPESEAVVKGEPKEYPDLGVDAEDEIEV